MFLACALAIQGCDSNYAIAGNDPVCLKAASDFTDTTQKIVCKISGCPEDKLDVEAFSMENSPINLFSVRVKQQYALYKVCMSVRVKDILNNLTAAAPVQFAIARNDNDESVRVLAAAFGAVGDKDVSNIAVDGFTALDGSYIVIGIPNSPNGNRQALQWNVTGWIERLRNSY